MGRMEESLQETDAQRRLLKLLENKDFARGVGSTLAEIAVELADAKLEARHWKEAFGMVRAEIRCLAGICISQRGMDEKLVVTEADLRKIPADLELFVGTPEPGVRIYELRRKSRITDNPKAPAIPPPLLARPH